MASNTFTPIDSREVKSFTYRSARSGSLIAGIGIAVAIETVALHFLLVGKHPGVAWALTLSSVSTIAWLVGEYRAMASGAITVADGAIDMRVGRRVSVQVPLAAIATAIRPTWRDLPRLGAPTPAGYLNLTKPGSPNVLLSLTAPVPVRILGMKRQASQIALHLDQPDEFLAAISSS